MVSFCGQTEKIGSEKSRWGLSQLTWAIDRPVPAVKDQQAAILDAVFAGYSAACGLSFKQVESTQQANIFFSAMRGQRAGFDGSGGTLAFAYLPSGSNFKGQLGCYFDLDEQWQTKIDFAVVALHEIGHNMGLDHSTSDADVMAPIYNPAMKTLQPGDIKRLQDLYGPSKGSTGNAQQDWLRAIKTIETRLLINGVDVGALNTINR